MKTKSFGSRLFSLFAYYKILNGAKTTYGRIIWRLSLEEFSFLAKNDSVLRDGTWVEKILPEICKKHMTTKEKVLFCTEEEYCGEKRFIRRDENQFGYTSNTIPTIIDVSYLYLLGDKSKRYTKQIDILSINEKVLKEFEDSKDLEGVAAEICKNTNANPQTFRFVEFPSDYKEEEHVGDILVRLID